jgi:sugar phosphate isomerase/epimerase
VRSFRIGTTSFIYRAGWHDNVARLGGRVEDVELLCFEAAQSSVLPSGQELSALATTRDAHGLSFSVHTPLAASLASESEARRRDGVDSVLRVLEGTRPLAPEAYVVHVYLGDCEHDPNPPTDLPAWRARAARSFEELFRRGVSPSSLCVESIDYDFALLEPLLVDLGLAVALDIGHLHRDGRALRECIDRYLPKARIVQWHGTDPEDRDHRSLLHYPEDDARWLLRTLCERRYTGVLTLEVFREDDFEESLALVQRWLQEVAP